MRTLLRRPGLHNLTALTVIQGSNALVPLLIVPFALSSIGTGAYAQVAITEAISALVLAAVLFSFDVDGVARVARLGRDAAPALLGAALGEVLAARLLLFVVAAPLAILAYVLAGGQSVLLLALWLLVPLGHVFHAYWFYQAIEHNVPPAAFTLLSRVATLGIVFGLVREPQDAALIPLAIGGPFVVGGLVSLWYVVLRLQLPLRPVSLATILTDLRRGKEVFAGNISVSLYREMNVVILGIVGVSAAGIATYALVEKSIKMLQAVTRPLNQFFFPKVLRALPADALPDRASARLIARYTMPQLAAVLVLMILVALGYAAVSPLMPRVRALGALPGVKEMATIMAPAMLFGIANFMFGTAGLNALQQRGYLFLVIMATGVASVALCFVLSIGLGATGAALCFVTAEAMLFGLIMLRYRNVPVVSAARIGTGEYG